MSAPAVRPRALEQLVIEALLRNGCPLTLAELVTDTNQTAYAVGRALTDLTERQQVRAFEDAGDTLYQLLHL